jgi:peptidyl-prolyl cis-trans isomerase SurA
LAFAEADSILNLIRGGEEFVELAERFSDGPTASVGGELGWMRRDGSYVPEFEEAAFALPPGSVSVPVLTEFGYHLILVERVRGGERRVRHILIQPDLAESDVEANDARAESFAARLNAGETMVDLDMDPDTADLTIEQIAQTSPEFGAAMRDAEVGDVIGPIRVSDPRAPNGWGLAVVLDRSSGGSAEFSEFRGMIVERLRSQGLTETVIEGLRSQAYIDIRLDGS